MNDLLDSYSNYNTDYGLKLCQTATKIAFKWGFIFFKHN